MYSMKESSRQKIRKTALSYTPSVGHFGGGPAFDWPGIYNAVTVSLRNCSEIIGITTVNRINEKLCIGP